MDYHYRTTDDTPRDGVGIGATFAHFNEAGIFGEFHQLGGAVADGSNAFWYYHSVYVNPYVAIGGCYIHTIGIHVGAFSDAVDNSSSSECWGSMYDFLIYLYVCSYIANYYFREFSGGGVDYYPCFQRRL